MKKILSIITAAAMTAASLSAVTVTAAEKITAEEVETLIYATGLSAYPEFWDIPTYDINARNDDVLSVKKETVKDVIDVNKCYAEYTLDKDKCAVAEDPSEVMSGEGISFIGLDSEGRSVSLIVYIGDNPGEYTSDYSNLQIEPERLSPDVIFKSDFAAIADAINVAGIGNVTDIKFAGYSFCSCVYVKDADGNEYAISDKDYTDSYAEKLGREVFSIKQGETMDFAEWYDHAMAAAQNSFDYIHSDKNESVIYPDENTNGDEVRDTDTRAPYIGAESKFADVSGDLVSYVNELNDLGIINGYEDGAFRPENTITRAEAVSMLARMMKYEGSYDGRFIDVSKGDWFADDVAALVEKGIINGYDDVTFAPQNDIKYQEVMKILVYTLGYSTYVSPNAYPKDTNYRAIEMGLTEGIPSFDTTAAITRGDMAIMLSNALDTHLFTMTVQGENEYGNPYSAYVEDITLIDYINGGKLNGELVIE